MAVVTTKSAAITARDANSLANSRNQECINRTHRGLVAIANGDSIASKLIFTTVKSNEVVNKVSVSSPDIGTTTAIDIGLYRTTKDGSAVVDADFFASAVALNAGALTDSNVTFESGVYTVANCEKPLWEAIGLTADPMIDYDIVGTLTGAADAAGSVLVTVETTI